MALSDTINTWDRHSDIYMRSKTQIVEHSPQLPQIQRSLQGQLHSIKFFDGGIETL